MLLPNHDKCQGQGLGQRKEKNFKGTDRRENQIQKEPRDVTTKQKPATALRLGITTEVNTCKERVG